MNPTRRPDPAGGYDELVTQHIPLARRIARRYSRGHGIDADLQQVAFLGLVLAAGRYQPEVGPFQPYAMATVSGEVKRYLRDTGWSVRVSRSLQEQAQRVEQAEAELAVALNRSPTPAEIGSHLGLSVEDVLAAARARDVRFADSLDDHEIEGAEDDLAFAVSVRTAIEQLDPEDQLVLGLQFEQQLTQREVAARLGVSQSQVHRRVVIARDRLRRALEIRGVSP